MSPQQPGVTGLPEEVAAPPAPLIHPLIAQAQETFRRDLPRLLKERPGQWVAYSGDRVLGYGSTKTAVYQECLRQGHERGTFVVRLIGPQVEMDFLGSVADMEFPEVVKDHSPS